jgi:Rap1a immunity proteins
MTISRLAVKLLAIIAVSLLFAGSGRAEDFSGVDLYRLVSERGEKLREVGCVAYVHGILDGMAIGRLGKYCPPNSGVSVDQGRLILEKFMRDNPETLHKQAGLVAASALVQAFPCKEK